MSHHNSMGELYVYTEEPSMYRPRHHSGGRPQSQPRYGQLDPSSPGYDHPEHGPPSYRQIYHGQHSPAYAPRSQGSPLAASHNLPSPGYSPDVYMDANMLETEYMQRINSSPDGRRRKEERTSSEHSDVIYGASGYGYTRGDIYDARDQPLGAYDVIYSGMGDRHMHDNNRVYQEPKRHSRSPRHSPALQRHSTSKSLHRQNSSPHEYEREPHRSSPSHSRNSSGMARSRTVPTRISPIPHREISVQHQREGGGATKDNGVVLRQMSHSPKFYHTNHGSTRKNTNPHRESPRHSQDREQRASQRYSGSAEHPEDHPIQNFQTAGHVVSNGSAIAKPKPLYYDDGKGNYRIRDESLDKMGNPRNSYKSAHQQQHPPPNKRQNTVPRERPISDFIVTSSTLLRNSKRDVDPNRRSEGGRAGSVKNLDGPDGTDADREVEDLFNRFWAERNSGNIVTWEQLQQDEMCQRCGKKVYPVERIDVGAVYHRGCFKCRVCGRQLTLTTFQRELDLKADSVKEVFCNQHVPKLTKGLTDADALGIRSVLDAQKLKSTPGKSNLQMTEKGWQYDPTESPGFQYARNVDVKYTLKRRATFRSFSDFERHGVFEAQTALERLHRQEEDELYRQMASDRDGHLERLSQLIEEERGSTVRQLVDWFTTRGMSQAERNGALKRLDEFFDLHHESQRELLLSRLATEEQAAVARMVEKHSREMLALIRQKELRVVSISEESDVKEVVPPEELEEDTMSTCPERAPPENNKDAIYTTPEVFKDQDNQAIEESKKDHKSFTDLVRRLTKRCETELQKVRAIFRWITVKNLDQMDFADDLDADSPLAILRGIKHGTESYHDLFKRLCSYAGLHCEIIEGYSKGAGFRPGSRMSSSYRNQWTAVWVEGAWRFINCKWGARHVTGVRTAAYTYKCDEFYFLTDPEQHIFQHFPDETDWQLMERPISIQDFTSMPVVKSPFFNNRLSFCANYDAVVDTRDGFVEVRLYSKRLLPFAAKLKAKHHEISSKVLEDRTLIRTIGREVVIITNLPCPGSFYLDVFVASGWNKDSMNNACAFQIHCTDVSQDANLSFPVVGMYGPTPFFAKMGMSEDKNSDPYITCHGEALITISLAKNVKIAHALKRWDARDRTMADYDRFAFMRHRNDTRATFVVRCPRRGQYVLSIYGALVDAASTDDDMPCVNRYYIECKAPVLDACALPKATRRWKYCRLLEPMQGDLTINADVHFKLESKLALDIAVSIEGKWHGLEVTDATWHGTVFTGTNPGKAMVYGRFDPAKEKYVPLLEYRLVETRRFDYVNSNV